MHGMINKSIEDLVTIQFGADKWEAVKLKAGVTEPAFISNQSYPDAMTYGLVGAATEVLGLTADQVLYAFGEFWVTHTAFKGYGDMLMSAGRTIGEFLDYLPLFHTRVALIFPNLKPPRFECSDRHENRITLHYFSDRPGLSMVVAGMLNGISKLYKTPAVVTHTKFKDKGADHDEFLVNWGAADQK